METISQKVGQDSLDSLLLSLQFATEQLFTDQSINNNRKLRKAIQKNSKGYVDFKVIGELPSIKEEFNKFDNISEEDQKFLLRHVCTEKRKQLWCNHNQVKRLRPYISFIKKNAPVYLTNIRKKFTKEQLLKFLDQTSNIYCIVKKSAGFYPFCLVYCEFPDKIVAQKQEIEKEFDCRMQNSAKYKQAMFHGLRYKIQTINPSISWQDKVAEIRQQKDAQIEMLRQRKKILGENGMPYPITGETGKYVKKMIQIDEEIQQYETRKQNEALSMDPLEFDNENLLEKATQQEETQQEEVEVEEEVEAEEEEGIKQGETQKEEEQMEQEAISKKETEEEIES